MYMKDKEPPGNAYTYVGAGTVDWWKGKEEGKPLVDYKKTMDIWLEEKSDWIDIGPPDGKLKFQRT